MCHRRMEQLISCRKLLTIVLVLALRCLSGMLQLNIVLVPFHLSCNGNEHNFNKFYFGFVTYFLFSFAWMSVDIFYHELAFRFVRILYCISLQNMVIPMTYSMGLQKMVGTRSRDPRVIYVRQTPMAQLRSWYLIVLLLVGERV